MKTTPKQELFIQVDYKLLQDPRFSLSQTIIISYFKGYQREDGFFYDTQENLSKILGISLPTLKRDIKYLLELGIIFFKTKSDIDGKRQYKNRKAIIFVDEKNPLPKKIESAIAAPAAEPEAISAPIENNLKTPSTVIMKEFQLMSDTYGYPDDVAEQFINHIKINGYDSIDEMVDDVKSNPVLKQLMNNKQIA